MSKLSTNELDRIPGIPLTLELARGGREMPDDAAKDRMQTAKHEAAHLVAAIACKSSIIAIELEPYKKSRPGTAGLANTVELLEWHTAWVYFAGAAWEKYNGDIERANDDLAGGIQAAIAAGTVPFDLFCDVAEFVEMDAEQVIGYAAVGILLLMPKNGILEGRKLAALVSWLKPHIPVLVPPKENLLREACVLPLKPSEQSA
jgi:hypothetical protein